MPKQSPSDDNVGRMQFLLGLRRRGISDPAVLRAMDEYQAAILSRLAREVISVERYRTLAEAARQRLAALGYDNVEVRLGDGLAGVPERAPYDRIIVTAAAETIPEALLQELAEDGVMVLPLGPHAGPQQLVKLTKGEQAIKQEDLIGVRFVPLLPGKAREL